MQLRQRPGGPDFCWSGHTLARGTLVAILVGSITGTLLLFCSLLALCTWRARRHCLNKNMVTHLSWQLPPPAEAWEATF